MLPIVLAALALSFPGQPRVVFPVASVFDDAWRHHVRHEHAVAHWKRVEHARRMHRLHLLWHRGWLRKWHRIEKRREAVWVASRGSRAVRAALSQVGVPYVWGGESPGVGFDCSGLVQWAYRTVGVYLPRTTFGMASSGYPVSLAGIQAGDLVLTNGFEHVVMYVGNGVVVAAPHSGAFVGEEPLSWFPIDEVRRVA